MPLVRTPMIAPTSMYRNFPTSSPEEAAEMVASAILTRQPEVSTRLGKVGETVHTIAPGLLQFVMTGAYHLFPDSAPREGQRPDEPGEEEISVEAATMAYIMRGIHFKPGTSDSPDEPILRGPKSTDSPDDPFSGAVGPRIRTRRRRGSAEGRSARSPRGGSRRARCRRSPSSRPARRF